MKILGSSISGELGLASDGSGRGSGDVGGFAESGFPLEVLSYHHNAPNAG